MNACSQEFRDLIDFYSLNAIREIVTKRLSESVKLFLGQLHTNLLRSGLASHLPSHAPRRGRGAPYITCGSATSPFNRPFLAGVGARVREKCMIARYSGLP